jgi:hypothetical protein
MDKDDLLVEKLAGEELLQPGLGGDASLGPDEQVDPAHVGATQQLLHQHLHIAMLAFTFPNMHTWFYRMQNFTKVQN